MRWKSVLSALTLAIAVIATPGTWGGAEAANAYVSLSSSSINFGTVQVGSSDLKNVQVTNVTSSTVYVDTAAPTNAAFTQDQVSAPDTPRAGACWYDGSGGHTRTQIDPGQSCLLYYRFTPTAAGSVNATSALTVYDFVGSPLDHDSIALTGTGQTVTPPHAATTGSVTVTPTSASFGSVNVDETKTLVLTIKNTSNGYVQLKPTYPAGKPFADAVHQAGDCWNASVSLVLATNDTCTIRPTFAPTAGGSFSGNLSVGIVASSGQRGEEEAVPGSPPLASKAVAMSGTGVAAAFTVSPTSASFGNVTITRAKALKIILKNTAKVPLMFKVTYPDDGPFSLDTTPTSNFGSGHCIVQNDTTTEYWGVAVGATCDLTATFAPFATGAAKATYVISAYRAAVSGDYVTGPAGNLRGTKNLAATGTGVLPTFSVTPSPLAFGNVTLTDSKQLTAVVKNTSDIKLGFTFEPTGDDYEVVPATTDAGHCDFLDAQDHVLHLGLASGESCDVVLEFRPFTAGSRPGTLKVSTYGFPGHFGATAVESFPDDPLTTKTINTSGTGVAPTFSVTPSPLAFGNVTLTDFKQLTAVVKNTSAVKLGFTFEPSDDYEVVPAATDTGHCDFLDAQDHVLHLGLASGESCDVVLKFRPFTAGSRPGTLKVSAYEWPGHFGATAVESFLSDPLATKTVNVSGTGVAPTFSVTPSPLAFGNVNAGGSKRLTAVVKNTSSVKVGFAFDATGDYEVVPGADNQGHCVWKDPQLGLYHLGVASGGSCDVVLEFKPTKAGSSPGTLKVSAYEWPSHWGAESVSSLPGDPLATKTVNASGTGVAPTFTITPTSYNFGSLRTAENKSTMVEVHNTSNVTLQVAVDDVAPFFAPGGAINDGAPLPAKPPCFGTNFQFQFERFQLKPGTSCWVTVDFEPTAGGSVTRSIPFHVHTGFEQSGGTYVMEGPMGPALATKNFSASGTGVAPTWTVSPTSVAFGNVTGGATKFVNVRVTNTSDRLLQVNASATGAGFRVEPGEIQPGVVPSCKAINPPLDDPYTYQLRPGDECELFVAFNPTTTGSRSGKVDIKIYPGDAGFAGQYAAGEASGTVLGTKSVSLSGSGVAPTFTITPTSYNFGSVASGSSKSTMVEVHNTSTVVVKVSVDSVAPFFAAGGVIDDGAPLPAKPPCFGTNLQFQDEIFELGPAKSCWVNVRFSPTVTGSKSASVPFHIHAGVQDAGGTYTMAGPMPPVLATKNFSASGTGVH